MAGNRIANRYAKALLDTALEKKQAEGIRTDMAKVSYTMKEENDLRALLDSPIAGGSDKLKALKSLFAGVNPLSSNLMDLLVKNNRISELNDVAEAYVERYDSLKEESVAEVSTAVPLSKELEKKILAKIEDLTKKKVSIINHVDPSIVGGFVLRLGDLRYDASVHNKLNNIKREFSNSI